MKKLEQAMFEYLGGSTEVEDITARYEPIASTTGFVECTETCQVSCQNQYELSNHEILRKQQKLQELEALERKAKVVAEEDKVICAECRYHHYDPKTVYQHRCVVKRRKVRDPLTGEWDTEGELACGTVNSSGDCQLYEEIPDCDLRFSDLDKRLYKLRLLKVWWDGDEGTWRKKLGLRRKEDD